jgi:hypothetical protein
VSRCGSVTDSFAAITFGQVWRDPSLRAPLP